jgi:hypothetical protein
MEVFFIAYYVASLLFMITMLFIIRISRIIITINKTIMLVSEGSQLRAQLLERNIKEHQIGASHLDRAKSP